jgi:Flp pilus assembly protein CpaB
MNLLAIIVIFLAITIAGAIAYIAWEISSDKPRVDGGNAASREDGPPDA